jgi:hypothetical protein
MTASHYFIAAALAGAIAAQLPPSPATPDVPVSVLVVDAANKPVTGLTAADFEAFVDASAVPITSVAPRGPLSLAVVVDTTRSTGWGRTGSIRAPQEEVIAALMSLRNDDRLRFGSFGPRVRFAAPWRPREGRNLRDEVEKAFKADASETHGPSPIWDVVYETVQMLALEPPPRAILLLSDGRSTGNSRSVNLVADYAAAHGVAIHCIVRYFEMQIPQGNDLAVAVRPWVALDLLATFSGGTAVEFRVHELLRGMELSEQLGWAMRDSYIVRIAPAADGSLHQLDVRVKRPNLKIYAPVAVLSPKPR